MSRYFCSFILLAFLGSCTQTLLDGNPDSRVVDFNVHGKVLIVEAVVNGKTAKFLIDTGASVSILDINQTKRYGLEVYQSNDAGVVGLGGNEKLMEIKNIMFNFKGEQPKRYYSFYGLDLKKLNYKMSADGIKILGILGSDFLYKKGAIINYQRELLYLTHNSN